MTRHPCYESAWILGCHFEFRRALLMTCSDRTNRIRWSEAWCPACNARCVSHRRRCRCLAGCGARQVEYPSRATACRRFLAGIKCEAFMIHNLVNASVLALTCIACPAIAAIGSDTAYDGSWGVVIHTRSGACDRSYQSGARIRNGIISSNTGGIKVGRVSPQGVVRVSVSLVRQSASGSGRLSSNSGSGVWRGQGKRGKCSGTWAAQRRG